MALYHQALGFLHKWAAAVQWRAAYPGNQSLNPGGNAPQDLRPDLNRDLKMMTPVAFPTLSKTQGGLPLACIAPQRDKSKADPAVWWAG